MNLLAKMRKRKEAFGRRAVGAFAFVWLSMALQPCVMALGGDAPCAHCPPAMAAQHGSHDESGHGHADHGSAHEGMSSHDHSSQDTASTDSHCADSDDCSALDEYNYDGRTPKTGVKDVQAKVFAILAPPGTTVAGADCKPAPASQTVEYKAGASPPLHVLNCVYLD